MKMTTELVKIDPKEFGLEDTKAAEIAAQFQPMLDRMVSLEDEFNAVVNLPIEEQATAVKAKELRLRYVKIRTGTSDIHKQQKAFYLAGGRFVDGWKNAQIFASQGKEEKLEAIEKYAENLERERIALLQAQRESMLVPFATENVSALNLGMMSEDVWSNFLTGTKTNFEAKIAAEKKAEEDRIAKEKAEAEERERIRIENAKLKAAAEAREKEIAKERIAQEAIRKAEQAKSDALLEAQRKQAAKAKAEADAKLKAEREENERLQAEIKTKQEAEAKAKREADAKAEAEEKARIAAEAKAAKAPRKKKLKTWIETISLIAPAGMEDDNAVLEISEKFEAFKNWAQTKIENL